jgi:hypothetical protein
LLLKAYSTLSVPLLDLSIGGLSIILVVNAWIPVAMQWWTAGQVEAWKIVLPLRSSPSICRLNWVNQSSNSSGPIHRYSSPPCLCQNPFPQFLSFYLAGYIRERVANTALGHHDIHRKPTSVSLRSLCGHSRTRERCISRSCQKL